LNLDSVNALEVGVKFEVLSDSERLEQDVVLGTHAQVLPQLVHVLEAVNAEDFSLAFSGLQQASEH